MISFKQRVERLTNHAHQQGEISKACVIRRRNAARHAADRRHCGSSSLRASEVAQRTVGEPAVAHGIASSAPKSATIGTRLFRPNRRRRKLEDMCGELMAGNLFPAYKRCKLIDHVRARTCLDCDDAHKGAATLLASPFATLGWCICTYSRNSGGALLNQIRKYAQYRLRDRGAVSHLTPCVREWRMEQAERHWVRFWRKATSTWS